jgi:hypothetical protein
VRGRVDLRNCSVAMAELREGAGSNTKVEAYTSLKTKLLIPANNLSRLCVNSTFLSNLLLLDYITPKNWLKKNTEF